MISTVTWVKSAFVLPLLASLTLASPAQSCACCADTADRSSYTTKIDDWLQSELSSIQFADTAHLYVTACDIDCAKGIRTPQYDYQVKTERKGGALVFTFSSPDSKGGVLTMNLPDSIDIFRVDPAPAFTSNMTLLYKEWRLSGSMVGTGDFLAGINGPVSAELILQGRGNTCPFYGDFTHWRLSASGAGVDFVFWGKTIPPE
ncbi:MAG: hypothetical protein GY952_07050 [Rhodobacteraceae bacterium]|nr:hypothetical protein [Paracoccaceae bacterium]